MTNIPQAGDNHDSDNQTGIPATQIAKVIGSRPYQPSNKHNRKKAWRHRKQFDKLFKSDAATIRVFHQSNYPTKGPQY